MHGARFAHYSWYVDARAQVVSGKIYDARGGIDTRTESGISERLRRELRLDDAMDWEMCEPHKRIWLLDGPSLERLAQELALGLHRGWLLQVIDAKQLCALKKCVDERAVHVVIEEVPTGRCLAPSA